ncbi:MAG TPA: TldD/PmbA family protein [Polyangia bacterium]
MKVRFSLALAGALSLALVKGAAADVLQSPIVTSMQEELSRAMHRLRLPGYEAPYFIAYSVRDYDTHEITARYGGVISHNQAHNRQAYVEVRVGSYQLDNTSSDRQLQFDMEDPDAYEPGTDAPLDDDPEALRGTLWLLTDAKYKQALAAYAKKRGRLATSVVEDADLPSFSHEQPSRHADPITPFHFAEPALETRAKQASALFQDYPDLFDSSVKIGADRVTRYFVSSEGSVVVTERTIFSAHVEAATRAKDGMLLQHEKDFYGRTAAELPDLPALKKSIIQLATELRALREAPVIDPYTGPALLMEQAAGVFFHETVGHRLEGERQNDDKEGRTFKGQIGKHVLPDFLSVTDDPTAQRAAGESLNGYYTYDDEGVAARPVTLIDHGVLRDFLKSRTPIEGSLRSNGHGRAEGTNDPMGRMANLFVRSSKQLSLAQLKAKMLEEVRRQHKPFGLIIRDITGGSTNTTNYGYQAFKGEPRLVYRVDAKTGKETLVRGVEMVGTPLTTVSRIVATSNTLGVFNGFCGAESGFVPVSTVAPAILMSEIELQRTQKEAERPPILPPPWAEHPTARALPAQKR